MPTYVYIYAAISNGNRKPRRFSVIQLPFARCANKRKFFLSFADEETNGSYPFANGLNRLAHLRESDEECSFYEKPEVKKLKQSPFT
jgi:hypothetical protein